jgi:hypothetical protein
MCTHPRGLVYTLKYTRVHTHACSVIEVCLGSWPSGHLLPVLALGWAHHAALQTNPGEWGGGLGGGDILTLFLSGKAALPPGADRTIWGCSF